MYSKAPFLKSEIRHFVRGTSNYVRLFIIFCLRRLEVAAATRPPCLFLPPVDVGRLPPPTHPCLFNRTSEQMQLYTRV